MRGNFGQKWQNSPKLPRAHVALHCNANEWSYLWKGLFTNLVPRVFSALIMEAYRWPWQTAEHMTLWSANHKSPCQFETITDLQYFWRHVTRCLPGSSPSRHFERWEDPVDEVGIMQAVCHQGHTVGHTNPASLMATLTWVSYSSVAKHSDYKPGGHRFDSCWENSDFFSEYACVTGWKHNYHLFIRLKTYHRISIIEQNKCL